jgi:hypothetical protein
MVGPATAAGAAAPTAAGATGAANPGFMGFGATPFGAGGGVPRFIICGPAAPTAAGATGAANPGFMGFGAAPFGAAGGVPFFIICGPAAPTAAGATGAANPGFIGFGAAPFGAGGSVPFFIFGDSTATGAAATATGAFLTPGGTGKGFACFVAAVSALEVGATVGFNLLFLAVLVGCSCSIGAAFDSIKQHKDPQAKKALRNKDVFNSYLIFDSLIILFSISKKITQKP